MPEQRPCHDQPGVSARRPLRHLHCTWSLAPTKADGRGAALVPRLFALPAAELPVRQRPTAAQIHEPDAELVIAAVAQRHCLQSGGFEAAVAAKAQVGHGGIEAEIIPLMKAHKVIVGQHQRCPAPCGEVARLQ